MPERVKDNTVVSGIFIVILFIAGEILFAYFRRKRIESRPERYEKKMKELKDRGYKIYIQSNYSEYLFKKHTDSMPFRTIIDGGIVSYEVGSVKPEPEIYKKIIDRYSLNPAECIFYDDIEKNIESAIMLGIEGHLVTSEEDLLNQMDLLKQ